MRVLEKMKKNKCVPCYAVLDTRPVCLVFLLDQYFNKLPQYAFKEDVLYRREKSETSVDASSPWYNAVPVGKNKLANMVKDMCV